MKNVNIAVIGFGNIGRAFVRVLALKRKLLAKKYGVNINVVAVVDSKGMVIKPSGLDDYEMLKLCEVPKSGIYMFGSYAKQGVNVEEVYSKAAPNIHVELTPANYVSGEPGFTNIMLALKRGAHVVTANKAPLVLHYEDIMAEARVRKLAVKFRATVMGGTPFLEVLASMKSHDIEKVEGILNATTNYILTEMHDNLLDFEQALKKAQALGIAETDPTLDIEGFDAAAKLTIISYVIGKPININSIYRESVTKITLKDVLDAVKQGQVIKYIASLDAQKMVASVKIERIPRENVFAQINGTLNGVKIKSDATELFFIGRGGGRMETAHTVLDDVLEVALRWFT
jgi:homoserine dehydrogenase